MSATACAENGGQATATASATSETTATAVAEAASISYAAVFESLQSCSAGGDGGGTVDPASLQCVVLPNTNLDGDMVQSTTAPTQDACCELCKRRNGCNVFAYCPLPPPGW